MGNHNPELRGGEVSWAILAGVITALEFRRESLSNAYSRGRSHPVGKYAIRAAALYTLLHLEDLLPDKLDIFDRIARREV